MKEGYGQGEGSSYKPWLRVQDVSSLGRSRKVPGIKSGRTLHLLSDLEYFYFLLLEFSDEVVDIREQFPVTSNTRAQDIAAEMGIRYPMYAGTQVPFVLTSDFLVTRLDANGNRHLAIRTCKYESELSDPNTGLRSIEKLELERAIWADQGEVDWKIVTENIFTPVLKSNLDWLHKSVLVDETDVEEVQRLRFVEALAITANGDRVLSSVVRAAASIAGIPYRIGMSLFKRMVWQKYILLNIENERLDPTLPCPQLTAAVLFDTQEIVQRAA